MSTKLTSLGTAHYILLARCFVVILGCAAVWWGIVGFPIFWQGSSTERIADQIIAGDPFKAEILAKQLPMIDNIETSAYCRPSALRSAAIIQLRMVEAAASANDRKPTDEQFNSLGKVVRNSLFCSPADPFLWLVLFWIENTENGPSPAHLRYLRMSYQLGPNEGWIALKRNRIALGIFERLPPDLAEMVINEFATLLDSGFYGEVAAIFTGPVWQARNRLLAGLKNVAERYLRAFDQVLHAQGYDVTIPKVERWIPRPWQ